MSTIKRSFLRPKPQELGKIKIGGKGAERQKSGGTGTYRIPQKYDHFVVTTRVRGENDNFAQDEEIHAKIGEKPMELRGVLMFQTVEENFHSEMVQYQGRSKIVSCDGEERTDVKGGAVTRCPKAAGGACPCKPYSRLHLQLWDSPYTGGYHVFRTTSWETTNNIQTALEEIFALFGTLYQAPVKLILYPAEDTYEEKGETKTSKSWKVGLVLAMSREETARQMVETKRQLEVTRAQLALTAGEVQADLVARDAEEAKDIGEEYFPPEAPTPASDLEHALRAAANGRPVVDVEAEADDPSVPEPVPVANAERASGGMLAQLTSLIASARKQDVPGLLELEAKASVAEASGLLTDVRAALTAISLALVESRARAADTPKKG